MCQVLKNGLAFLRVEAANQNPAAGVGNGEEQKGWVWDDRRWWGLRIPRSTCPQEIHRNDGLPYWIF